MPRDQKLVRFNVPEAHLLESLSGIAGDLRDVIAYAELLTLIYDTPKRHLEYRALSEAAVVKYARCFSSGVRNSLSHKLLDTASKQLKDAHNYFMALRNMHIAHSVSELESHKVLLVMRKEKNRFKPWDIMEFPIRASGLSERGRHSLPKLCHWLLATVEPQLESERDRVFKLALLRKASELSAGAFPGDLLCAFEPNAYKRVRKK